MLGQQMRVLPSSKLNGSQRPFVAAGVSRRQVAVSAGVRLAPLVDEFKADQLKSNLPDIRIGDSVRLGVLVQDGKNTRTQRLDGTVIAEAGTGSGRTITVRRIFQGVGIEMCFLVHSPLTSSIEVLRRGRVRRAKLYYLRDRTGKNARLKELLGKKAVSRVPAAAAAAEGDK